MCDNCSKYHVLTHNVLVLPATLDEDQLALWSTLKDIHDSAKLQRMMPPWIKAHNRAVAPPKPVTFMPGLPPQFASGLPLVNKEALSFFKSYWGMV